MTDPDSPQLPEPSETMVDAPTVGEGDRRGEWTPPVWVESDGTFNKQPPGDARDF
ncbi:hypothetical protein [Antrihabitans cavernicola]|uniref:hypothetical protein n=1 Tax=Antrihabitans cavernicola TaxID=2495913 RepID=UPI001658CB7A|nr:hypothetical protein [Spelaeibacter cavernicola]